MMNPLFQVSEQDIEFLDQLQLTDILNRLLKAEAQRYGIPPLSVKTTLRINDPDGGVDARVEHSISVPATCRIPEGLSVWQYKAGDITPKSIREEESQKRGVQDAIQAGGSYCFVIGRGCSDTKRKNREEAVNHCYIEKGLVIKGKLFTAQDIADWVSDHPSVAIQPHFRRPVHDELLTFDNWNNLPELRAGYVDFEIDDQRQVVIDKIGEVVTRRTGFAHVGIAGRAGIGKTRLALEAVRANGLENDTLYALSPAGIPSTLFSHIEASPNIRLVLVVDECTFEGAIRLHNLAQRCGDRLLLMTIEHERMVLEAETEFPLFWLDRLGDDALQRIVQKIAPTMPHELVSFIVKASSGYVKLTTAMTESLARNPGLIGAAQLTGVPDVRVILESLLMPDKTERLAMEALSLLHHVGLEEDVAVEGQVVANFMGIDFKELKRVAEKMRRNGLVVKRWRYRYVTPHLLAVWLASEVWRAMGEDIVNDLLLAEDGLPTPAAKEALLERLADLGEEEIAAPVVEKLLGPDGLFPGIEEVDDSFRSRILATLARAAPRAGAAALERILLHLPRDRLLGFRAGRRQVIWTLEGMLHLEYTFWTAARLLLKLAEAENETLMNNATGVWREIFYTHLSGTPIPAVERHRLIKEALDSPRVETRLLAVQAIQTALSTFESRARGPGVGGHIIPAEWHPETWGELWEVRRSALRLLDQALADQESQVVEAARKVLINAARGLVDQRLADEVLSRLQNLPLRTDAERRGMWELLQALLYHRGRALTEGQRECIEKWADMLVGDSFRDRLRRWVGKTSLADLQKFEESGRSPEEMAALMADEGYQNPDALRSELAWLASPDAMYFHSFGRRLGQLDSDHVWLEDLVAQIRNGGNPGLLSAYLKGRTESGEGEWVEQLLDEWAQNNQEMAAAVFDATWRRGGSDSGGARIVSLVDKGWIPPAQLGWLSWGGWVSPNISAEAMKALMERIVQDESPQATEGALSLLLRWLEHHPQEAQVMTKYASQLLIRPCAVASQGMCEFYWENVAEIYLPKLSYEIAGAILKLFTDTDFLALPEDTQMDILRRALIENPAEVWPLIGNTLRRKDEAGYRLRLSMREWGIETMSTAKLLEWAEEHKPEGARILANLAIPLTPLARQLLIRFGDDDHVGGALAATFLSGSFSGSEVAWLESKLATARKWLDDEHASVRKWAQEIVRMVEADISRARQEEEEQELWYG
jgi:hypothetical protein